METDINDWGLTHPYTCLVYRLKNIDPDDAYSSGKSHIVISSVFSYKPMF